MKRKFGIEEIYSSSENCNFFWIYEDLGNIHSAIDYKKTLEAARKTLDVIIAGVKKGLHNEAIEVEL